MTQRALTVSVSTVLFPVVELGLNDTVVPPPMPVAVNATEPAKPPDRLIVILLVPCEPREVVRLVGEAERVKLPDAAASPVSEIAVVCVIMLLPLPEVPVIVKLNVPVVAVLLAARERARAGRRTWCESVSDA